MCMCESEPSNLILGIRVAAPHLQIEFLDGMRGLAALYVVLFHAYQFATFGDLNASSPLEGAGDAAISISPDDMAGLTQAIDRLLSEPGCFSWQKTAELTAEAYHHVSRQ